MFVFFVVGYSFSIIFGFERVLLLKLFVFFVLAWVVRRFGFWWRYGTFLYSMIWYLGVFFYYLLSVLFRN